VPFCKPLFYKALKPLSLTIIPPDISIPSYFSTSIAFFLCDLLLLSLFLWIVYTRCITLKEYLWSGPSKWLLLFLLSGFASLCTSATAHYPLMYLRFMEVALIAVLFNSVRSGFDSQSVVPFLRCFAWILFSLAVFESLVSLAQYFTQQRVGLKFLGEPNRTHFFFVLIDGQSSIFEVGKHTKNILRSTGTFPHPNIFGGFAFCGLLTTFYLYITENKRVKILLFGIALQLLSLAVTFSRSAIIALGLSTAFYFFMQARSVAMRIRVKQLLVTLVLSTSICLAIFYSAFHSRGGIVNYNINAVGADSERLLYQKVACSMVEEHPFLGVGWGNFQLESHRFFPKEHILPSKVHNIYLLIASEAGCIGAACFLVFLYGIIRKALKYLSSPHTLFLFSLFAGLLFIGACDFYFLSTPHGRILFFGVAALLSSSYRTQVATLSLS
jgi:O-antigen ligase